MKRRRGTTSERLRRAATVARRLAYMRRMPACRANAGVELTGECLNVYFQDRHLNASTFLHSHTSTLLPFYAFTLLHSNSSRYNKINMPRKKTASKKATKTQVQKSTARDVFFYLLMIITLYASVISFIALLWQVINVQFPDPLEFYYSGAVDIMRTSIAALVIVWPVFLFISWLINRDLQATKEKQHTWVRRWLLYLTLFIAAITIIIDLVTLTNSFLGGELTARFVLKTLVVLAVAVTVFWFYLWELRRDASKKSPAHLGLGIGLSIVILGSIIGGFFIVGTPAQQRDIRLDQQRVGDLQRIQYEVVTHWDEKGELPTALEDLSTGVQGYVPPADPVTGEIYEYMATGDLSFTLCATFAADSDSYSHSGMMRAPVYEPYGYPMQDMMNNWDHGMGQHCFEREIDPELYDTGDDEKPTEPLPAEEPQSQVHYTNTSADEIVVASPVPGSEIESPLTVSGTARGFWFFEASASVTLVNWDGLIIAEGIIEAQEDWMTENFVPFEGQLVFTAPDTSVSDRGTLIIHNANPSGLPENDKAIELPVEF